MCVAGNIVYHIAYVIVQYGKSSFYKAILNMRAAQTKITTLKWDFRSAPNMAQVFQVVCSCCYKFQEAWAKGYWVMIFFFKKSRTTPPIQKQVTLNFPRFKIAYVNWKYQPHLLWKRIVGCSLFYLERIQAVGAELWILKRDLSHWKNSNFLINWAYMVQASQVQ